MNQQPDTKTLAGKIAVMQAHADGKWIDFSDCEHRYGWNGITDPKWNWTLYDYRIHPDDLNPPRKPREVWIAEYPNTIGCAAALSELVCRACANPDIIRVIKFREVIE